jgi:SpoIID/LytB domain protein
VTGLASSGHRYRYGTVDIAPTAASPSTLEVVNALRIHDEYLLGISEMSSSWPAAALQAQVLAARSYALSKFGTGGMRAACRCQVDSGKGPYFDQTFAGWAKESGPMGSAWRAAVRSTIASASTGRAVLSGGKPITAFYFSASGGSTQSSQDVWVAALPYVQSVDDHWSMDPSVPWSQWSPQVRTQAQVAAAFGLPDVVRIDLSVRTAAGGVKVATAWSSTGVGSSVTGQVLRTRLTLPSTWVWRALESAAGDPVASAVRVASASTAADVVVAPASSPVLMAVAQNLGAQKGWPVLLVQASGLPASTRAELVRRKASRVHIVGTTTEVPAAVATALATLSPSVTRYAGATVSDVSVTVAGQLGLRAGTQAMVSSATDSLGSVLASATASAGRRAFVVVPGGSRAAPSVTTYLGTLKPARTTVVGSATSVASTVFATWKGSVRVTGATAVDASTNVLATLGATTPKRLVLSTATAAAGALMSQPGAPVVVVTTVLPSMAASFLQRGITSVAATPGVPQAVVTAARRA